MYNALLLPELREFLEQDDSAGMAEFCEALHPAAVTEVLDSLEPAESWRVLSACSPERQGEIFKFLSLPYQTELVEAVDRESLSKLIEAMPPDDRVDLLERMNPERVEDLLPLVAQAERSDIRKLLSFPEDSAGSIMTTEYASLPEGITVSEALDRLRSQAPDRETIYYVYIIDEGRRLRGLVSLRELILAKPAAKLSEFMERDVISVRADDDQEFVAQKLALYDFIAIPVVDNQNQLVGIITHDDAMDVVQEEATEDAHRLGAVEPLEDSYLETALATIAWKRGIWLVFLMFAALITAAVLQRYEDHNATPTFSWMVAFLPLVLACGGNAGSQSATLIIRSLALEKMTREENLRIIRREFILAIMLGGSLMLLSFVTALCFDNMDAQRAVAVGLTVFLVVALGTLTGGMLPIGFRHVGMDPALMSNPLIAALIDVFGVLIYYGVALWLLA
jgi:magnesium transporter